MKVRLEPGALGEFNNALDYYLPQFAIAAEEFVAEIASARQLIGEFPNSGTQLRAGLRRVVLRKFPYSIIYRVESDAVRVFAIAHQKRRPGYWRKRLTG